MEQFEIERKATRFTYLIKDTNIEFYLVIPNNKKVSLVLNIIENINNETIKKIPDFMDKVLLIPILNNNIINYLQSNIQSYNQSDNYFSNLINMAYKILVHNNITVESQVYLNNDSLYSGFNNYFVNKFNGRVSLINLNLQSNNIPSTSNISTPKVEENVSPSVLDEIYNEEISLKSGNQEKNITTKKEPGFVSYVLLGVMIAILSLIFLYMLL